MKNFWSKQVYVFGLAALLAAMLLSNPAAAASYYWTGSQGPNWNTTTPGTNWATTSAGTTPQTTIPPTGSDIFFSATGAGNLTNSLGQNFSINALNFTSDSQPTIINGVNNTLTITTTGTGILVNSGAAAHIINTNIALGNSQTWTNSSANALTINGAVTGNAGITKTGSGNIIIGPFAHTYTDLTANGGTMTLGGTHANGGQIRIDNATVTVAAGAVESLAGQLIVGFGTTAAFNVSGTVNLNISNNSILLGQEAANSTTRILSGGTINVTNNAEFRIANSSSNGPISSLTIDAGGALNLSTASKFALCNTGGSGAAQGTLNVSGTINAGVPLITGSGVGNATAIMNFDGGTIRAGLSSTTFINLSSNAASRINIRNGGITLDSNGFDITIPRALLHSNIGGDAATDGGLTKIGNGTLTLSGANTFTGSTKVNGGTLRGSGTSTSSHVISAKLFPGTAAAITNAATYADIANQTLATNNIDFTTSGRLQAVITSNGSASHATSVVAAGVATIVPNAILDVAVSTQNSYVAGDITVLSSPSGTPGILNTFILATPLPVGWTVVYKRTTGSPSEYDAGGAIVASTVIPGGAADTVVIRPAAGTAVPTVIPSVTWTGGNSGAWDTATTGNWVTTVGGTATTYTSGATAIFTDSGANALNVVAGSGVSGGSISFTNATVPYKIGGVIGGLATVTKQGAATVTLTGANTYIFDTVISGGTLALGSGGSLGSTAVTVNSTGTFAVVPGTPSTSTSIGQTLALNAGSALTMVDGFTNAAVVAGNATIGEATGTAPTLTFELGNGLSAFDSLAISGTATIGATSGKIAVQGITGTNPTPGTYVLITGGANSTLATNPLTLTSFKIVVGTITYPISLSSTATAVTLTVGPGVLAEYYWTGFQGPAWNTVAGAATNWAKDITGATDAQSQPASVSDVFFSAAGAINLTNTLGQNYTINSLNFSSGSGAVTIGGANILTLSAAAGTGISVVSGAAAHTVNAPVTLAANQIWSNNSNNPLTVGGTVTNGGFAITSSGTGVTAISGPVAGTGGVVAAGAGGLTLSGTNVYSGVTSVTTGRLNINSNTALGTGALTISGGTIDNTDTVAHALSNNNVQNWNGDFAFAGTKDLSLGSGAVTLSASRNVTVAAGNLTVGGAISGSGFGITKAGTGNLILGGSNSFTGNMTITAGVVTLANTLALQNSTLDLGSVGTLKFDSSVVSHAFTLGGLNASVDIALQDNAVTPNAIALSLGNNNSNIGFTSAFTGPGSIIKVGSGTLSLSADNTYSGGTTLNGGQININSNTALGSGAFTINGNTFANNSGADRTLTNNNAQVWGNNFTFTGSGNLNMGTGAVSMTGSRTVTVNSTGVLTVGGVISGSNLSLSKSGSGTLVLTGDNTYTGPTNVQGGTLTVNGAHSAPNRIQLNGNSTMNINATAVETVTGDSFTLGNDATSCTVNVLGTFNLYSTGDTLIGQENSTGTGTLRIMSGGKVDVKSGGFRIGNTSTLTPTGVLTMDPGSSLTLDASSSSNGFVVGNAGGGTPKATVNLNGGVITTARVIQSNAGVATFNFNGGTLKAGFASTNFFSLGSNGSSRANVRDGGATIDTNGFDITIPRALLHSNIGGDAAIDGGVIKNGNGALTLSGANTYTGATVVNAGTLRGSGTSTSSFTVSANLFPGTAAGIGSGQAQTYADISNQTLATNNISFSATGRLESVITSSGGGSPVSHATSVLASGTAAITPGAVLDVAVSGLNAYAANDIVVLTSNAAAPGIVNTFVLAKALPPGWSVIYKRTTEGTEFNAGGVVAASTPITGTAADTVVVRATAGSVTPVTIASFVAGAHGSGALISWNCVSEFQNAGFNVYRKEVESNNWTRVNSTLIAGRFTSPDAKEYQLFDWTEGGRFEYRLESVSAIGNSEYYPTLAGPVTIDTVAIRASEISGDTFAVVADSIVTQSRAILAQAIADRFSELAVESPPGTKRGSSIKSGLVLNADGQLFKAATVRALNLHDALNSNLSTVSQAVVTRNVATPDASNVAIGARWFSAGASTSASTTDAAKVTYDTPGVLLIPKASLPAGFDINHVSIQREGRSVTALCLTPDGLLVAAPGYEDDYTNKDVYFLRSTTSATLAGTPTVAQGLFDAANSVNTNSPATASVDYHDVYFDYNVTFRPYSFAPWFSSKYLTDSSSQSFEISTPSANSGAAALTVNVWSLTQNSSAAIDHAVQVVVNNQPVGQAQWSGGNKMVQLTFQIPSEVLLNGTNSITLATPTLAGAEGQIAMLHSMTISYTRTLDGSKSVDVINDSNETKLFEVSNLPSASVWVIDNRYPERAALAASAVKQQTDGTYAVRFNAYSGGTGKYQIVPAGQENRPVSVEKRQLKALKSSAYLAVGPSALSAGVQPLLAQRQKEGIKAQFANQDQVFDYYNYGRFGPAGIQKAVQSLRPQYLLLLGKTTYDYKNYSGLNANPMCPTFLVSTSFWAQTTSDSAFGDLGRGYPEVAVGRLPVGDATELSVAISHILNYKGIPVSGIRLHAVSDKPDVNVADFGMELDTLLKANHPDITWQENYLERTFQTSPEVTAAMTAAANGEADIVLYSGHGNASRLGNVWPPILDQTSVQQWTGNVVFLQATCTSSWISPAPGYKSIAMQALTQTQGGISASIGTSTYMNSETAMSFMNQLLTNTNASGMRWGNALMKTQQWAAQQSGGNANWLMDMSKTEQLFGDPAMPVFMKSAPTQGSSGGSGTSGGTSGTAPVTGTF